MAGELDAEEVSCPVNIFSFTKGYLISLVGSACVVISSAQGLTTLSAVAKLGETSKALLKTFERKKILMRMKNLTPRTRSGTKQ